MSKFGTFIIVILLFVNFGVGLFGWVSPPPSKQPSTTFNWLVSSCVLNDNIGGTYSTGLGVILTPKIVAEAIVTSQVTWTDNVTGDATWSIMKKTAISSCGTSESLQRLQIGVGATDSIGGTQEATNVLTAVDNASIAVALRIKIGSPVLYELCVTFDSAVGPQQITALGQLNVNSIKTERTVMWAHEA